MTYETIDDVVLKAVYFNNVDFDDVTKKAIEAAKKVTTQPGL